MRFKKIMSVGILCTCTLFCFGQLSKRMTETAMAKWPVGVGGWDYEQGFVLSSIQTIYNKTQDVKYLQYIQNKINYLVNSTGNIWGYSSSDYNIDNIAEGRSLLFLHEQTGQVKYKTAADKVKSQLSSQPRTKSGGFWHKQIYPNQMWLDGIYMAEPFYCEYSKLYNQPSNFDDIAKQFILLNEKAKEASNGLLYHAWDESKSQRWADPTTGCSPSFWGRSLGWYVVGLVDVLDHFPSTHPQRDSLVTILQDLATAISKYQDPSSKLWYQVLDKPRYAKNYEEASASCMFVYALAKGVRAGYLDTSFWEVAEEGYYGVCNKFIKTDNAGKVHLDGTCTATGLGGNPYRDGSYEYYVNVSVATDDPRGVGAFILASSEIEMGKPIINADVEGSYASKTFFIYPNPTKDKVQLSSIAFQYDKVELYDFLGEKLMDTNSPIIDIGHLKSGTYVLRIVNEKSKISITKLVQKL